ARVCKGAADEYRDGQRLAARCPDHILTRELQGGVDLRCTDEDHGSAPQLESASYELVDAAFGAHDAFQENGAGGLVQAHLHRPALLGGEYLHIRLTRPYPGPAVYKQVHIRLQILQQWVALCNYLLGNERRVRNGKQCGVVYGHRSVATHLRYVENSLPDPGCIGHIDAIVRTSHGDARVHEHVPDIVVQHLGVVRHKVELE